MLLIRCSLCGPLTDEQLSQEGHIHFNQWLSRLYAILEQSEFLEGRKTDVTDFHQQLRVLGVGWITQDGLKESDLVGS